MIVDDDLYARIRIKTELRLEQDGFLVDKEAVSGPEALEKIKADPPDIVLTDMKMPGMSGVAFIEELHRIHPEIPVVALSGYDDYEYVRASLKLGAVDYLLKHEMSRETVLEALHKCVERLQLSAESGRFRQEEARELEQAADRRQEILRMLRGDCTGLHVPVFQGKNGTLQLIVMQIDHVRRIEKENGKLELLMMIPVILSLLQQVVDQYASGVVESTGEGQFVILASFEGMYSQQYIWKSCSFDPVNTNVWNNEALLEPMEYFRDESFFEIMLPYVEEGIPSPTNPSDAKSTTAQELMRNNVMYEVFVTGEKTPEQALTDAANEVRSAADE